tara:strand:+ start:51558 stop:52676 length:1119 start_codon:yes stop_codon:yes gene_type:complete
MAAFNLFNTLKNDLSIDTIAKTISVIPQLNKKDYAQVKNILVRLGGIWVGSEQSFTFTKCPEALIQRVLTLGSRRLNKFHFYPTPSEVFNYITEYTQLSFFGASVNSVRVLEPSCGEGSLMKQLKEFGLKEGRNFEIEGYDIDPLHVLLCKEAGFNATQADFLEVKSTPDYGLVIMNPPFNGDDFIKHIKHAQKFMTLNGLLISVVPTQWIKSFNEKTNRSWLFEQAQIDSTSDLDENNFFEPGTFKGVSISTTVICLRSREAADRILNSASYSQASSDAFSSYIDNSEESWGRLHNLKLKNNGEHHVLETVTKIVSNILADQSNETIHLVRRFRENYITNLMEDWFPEYAYKLTEPQQLDLGFGLETNQAA